MEPTDSSSHPPDAGDATQRGTDVEVLFIGTATVLLRLGPIVLLTDPNFLHQGEHARLGYGLRSRRLTEPALRIQQLPRLDAIVLSHHHGDHFDDRAARELDPATPIICNAHAARKLRRQGFRELRQLRTWEQAEVRRDDYVVRVTALPGRHAPQPLTRALPPVMGSMIELRRGGAVLVRIYVSGDTLLHDRLREIPDRFARIDLGLLHLGGTRVLGLQLTMDGSDGVEAIEIIRPAHAVPIHYDDYTVFRSPLDDFLTAYSDAERRPGRALMTEVHVLDRGESLRMSVGEGRSPEIC